MRFLADHLRVLPSTQSAVHAELERVLTLTSEQDSSGSWTPPSSPGGPRGVPEAADLRSALVPARIVSITSPCGGSMNAMTFIWPEHRADQRVDLVDPLDEHSPRLAGPAENRNRCGVYGRGCGRLFRGGGGFCRLPPLAAGLVRVPAVVADQGAPCGGICCVNSARNSSGSRIWKFRLGPRASPSRCGSGKARQASFSAL